ncbi:membrane protein FxsA [Vibrio mimicus]|nr:FxsA family protein [Vibrio mimicus]QXC57716.1 membrane protein FxsA [Vibrio mimicus]
MFPILLFLFIAVPVIEIALFIQVGGVLGLWPTIALVLLTAVVGASLVRSQGLQTLLTVQQRLAQGQLPTQHILEGVMLAVAGVLLLTPGFLTDMMGMLILLPAPRAWLAKYFMSRVVVRNIHTGGQGFEQPNPFTDRSNSNGTTYEGEFERKDDHDQHRLK